MKPLAVIRGVIGRKGTPQDMMNVDAGKFLRSGNQSP